MPVSTCKTCGRVMREMKDYPRGNFSSDFCCECVDEKGILRPKKVIRQNMIRYRVKSSGLTEEEAIESVDNLMSHLPAWRERQPSR